MKESNAKIMPFNPKDLGIDEYIPIRGNHGAPSSSDYLIFTKNKSGNPQMKLSLSADTKEFVIGMFGSRVSIGADSGGNVYVWPGNRMKVSNSGGYKPSLRGNISLTGFTDRLFEAHGEFRRLFMKMAPYSNGDALVFKPTGDRE